MPTAPVIKPRFDSPRRRGSGALILVVLVALLIILILYFNTGYMNQVSQTRKKGKQLAQDINTQQLSLMIADYREHNEGKLPTSWDQIEGLPRESYTDPWGKPMTFKCEEDKRTKKVTVTYHSDGPDGEPGGGDDIDRKDTLPY